MPAHESDHVRARRTCRPERHSRAVREDPSVYSEPGIDSPNPLPGEPPLARPTIALARQVFHDEIVLLGIRMSLPARDRPALERINREVCAALEFYGERGWLDRPEEFFEAPPPLTDVADRPVRIRRRIYERVVFDSGYEPRPGEPGRDRWLGYAANARVPALVLRHREPRPWVVCIHGALMGRGSVDLRLFRARHLHERSRFECVAARRFRCTVRAGTGVPPSRARTCSTTCTPPLSRCGTSGGSCRGYARRSPIRRSA